MGSQRSLKENYGEVGSWNESWQRFRAAGALRSLRVVMGLKSASRVWLLMFVLSLHLARAAPPVPPAPEGPALPTEDADGFLKLIPDVEPGQWNDECFENSEVTQVKGRNLGHSVPNPHLSIAGMGAIRETVCGSPINFPMSHSL
jgi:hypothetical protein